MGMGNAWTAHVVTIWFLDGLGGLKWAWKTHGLEMHGNHMSFIWASWAQWVWKTQVVWKHMVTIWVLDGLGGWWAHGRHGKYMGCPCGNTPIQVLDGLGVRWAQWAWETHGLEVHGNHVGFSWVVGSHGHGKYMGCAHGNHMVFRWDGWAH